MKAKAKSILGIVIGLVLGYVIGAFLGLPSTSGNAGQGNISKVSKYHSVAVNPAMNAFQEKLQNDSTELAKTALSLTVLTSRMVEFSELVNLASDAAQGNEALREEIETLQTVQRIADNAVNAGRVAASSLDGMMSGAKQSSANEYEQASQNLTVAYMMVDRQMQVAKHFVAAVDDFLKKNSAEQNVNLAAARDLWATYCAGSALINNDQEEVSYWEKDQKALSGEDMLQAVDSLKSQKLIASLRMDSMLGLYPDIEHDVIEVGGGLNNYQFESTELNNIQPFMEETLQGRYDFTQLASGYVAITLEGYGNMKEELSSSQFTQDLQSYMAGQSDMYIQAYENPVQLESRFQQPLENGHGVPSVQ